MLRAGGLPGHGQERPRSTATPSPARPEPRQGRRQGGYADAAGHKQYYASFAGFVPAEHPQLTVLVSLDEPPSSGEHYGAKVAAPLFVDVAREALRRFQIPPPVHRWRPARSPRAEP